MILSKIMKLNNRLKKILFKLIEKEKLELYLNISNTKKLPKFDLI